MDGLYFDPVAYSEYMDDLNYSQGFYVTTPEDGSVMLGGIRRVGEYSDDRYRKAEKAATFAVEEHNNKKEKGFLKYMRIVNLNVEPSAGAVYYITIAADVSGETRHYQVKVWEKLTSGYQVLIFRPAPYSLKSEEKVENKLCCVGVDNLMPWMDENYLYYKCFYKAHKQLFGVEVIHDRERGDSKGFLWFTSCAESEEILKQYVGKRMPHSNIFYDFD